ncbi:hypothetical protein ARALYDRAFT_353391 [Arabidopsis lyrata subsp. lyrata]|uniref:Uncharacterized protein n=1 Tax=Arabidopsis lyrata subsp. lyrata TaxID=81972 RepID=D7MF26_ARALL|nr:hypothetical protein ARALYDRAFT_353391 [Arabidopsis lyrata subsp. lyrata]
MGNKTSRKSKETSARNYTTELRSYEAACKEDMEIQSFDKRMQARTSHVISTLPTGVEVRALSFDSLKVVTESLLDMNQEVVKVILDCKKDMEESRNGGLQRVRVSHLLILGALHQFEEESLIQYGNGYKKTLEELKRFKDTERPFDQDFIKMFQSVYKQQMLMLEKLQLCKKKARQEAQAHPHMAKSLQHHLHGYVCHYAMAPLGSMGKWIDSLWKNYENAIKGQKGVISSMQAGTYVAVKDLDNIRDLIERLDIKIRGMVKNAEFAVEHDAVKIGINVIKKKLEVFQKNVEALGIQADICSREIIKARTVILQRIINHPNTGSCST